jgi:hypothetical protein
MMYSSAFFRVGMVLRETQKRARGLGMVLMVERRWLARAGLELDLAWVLLSGDWALSKFVLYGLAYFFGQKWKMLKKVTGWNDVGQLCFLKKKRMWLMQKIVVFLAKEEEKKKGLVVVR